MNKWLEMEKEFCEKYSLPLGSFMECYCDKNGKECNGCYTTHIIKLTDPCPHRYWENKVLHKSL